MKRIFNSWMRLAICSSAPLDFRNMVWKREELSLRFAVTKETTCFILWRLFFVTKPKAEAHDPAPMLNGRKAVMVFPADADKRQVIAEANDCFDYYLAQGAKSGWGNPEAFCQSDAETHANEVNER